MSSEDGKDDPLPENEAEAQSPGTEQPTAAVKTRKKRLVSAAVKIVVAVFLIVGGASAAALFGLVKDELDL